MDTYTKAVTSHAVTARFMADTYEIVAQARDIMSEIASSALAEGIPGIGLAADVAGTTVQKFAGFTNVLERHPLTCRSRFRMACIKHGLLAIALHGVRSPRRIDVEESLDSHLAEFASASPHGTVRIRHVLSHSTGYDYPSPARVPSSEARGCLAAVLDYVFPPGTYLYYNAENTLLLEQLLERHTGMSATALIDRHVRAPLQVPYSFVDTVAEHAIHDVAGHVRDPDLGSFLPISDEGQPQDLRMALPELVEACRVFLYSAPGEPRRKILTPIARLPPVVGGTAFRRFPTAYSLGWGIFENGLYGVNGSGRGQCCALRFDPDKRICFAVGLTIADAELRDQIVELLEQSLNLSAVQQAAAQQMEVTERTVRWITGEYAQTIAGSRVVAQVAQLGGSITIRVQEGQRVLPTLTVFRRNSSGCWIAAEGAKVIPIRFFISEGAKSIGLMIGATSFWRIPTQSD